MPAEEFFRGTTLGNREVVLFYEQIDEGQKITGTLDGEPLDIETVNWGGDSATVKTAEHGTFSATKNDYAEDHSAALRRYLEHRPSGGYEVTLVERGQGTAGIGPDPDAPATTCVVEISNGRLTERAEFRYSEQATRVLARGQDSPTDEQLLYQIAAEVRTDSWDKIRHRAEHPSFTWGLAHPL
jgi:hypothetical protein